MSEKSFIRLLVSNFRAALFVLDEEVVDGKAESKLGSKLVFELVVDELPNKPLPLNPLDDMSPPAGNPEGAAPIDEVEEENGIWWAGDPGNPGMLGAFKLVETRPGGEKGD